MATNEVKVFSGNANRPLATRICECLGMKLGAALVDRFPDGELNVRLDQDIRGADVYIVQPTCPPVNEYLMELLLMMDAARRASAARITAVIPYYGYARKDRKDEGRVPITAKLVANLLTTAGAHRVLTMDLHAAQIQGFFDIPVDHLFAFPVIVDYFTGAGLIGSKIAVAAPDVGRIKMARAYAKSLSAQLAVVDKRRTGPESPEVGFVIGDVRGLDVILVDDMITTGGTVVAATTALRNAGARSVRVCAVHAIFCRSAAERLAEANLEEVIVTDTVSVDERTQKIKDRLRVLSVAPLLAEAIQRIHTHKSISELFDSWSREP